MESMIQIISGREYDSIFIPYNVPSSKNSRQFNIDRRRSFNSSAYNKYIRKTEKYWNNSEIIGNFKRKLNQKQVIPYLIYFHFVRNSKRKFDWHNAIQGPLDLMVKYDWIEDDNCSIMVPAPIKLSGAYYSINRDNPGVYIIF